MYVYISDIGEHELLIGEYRRFSDVIPSRPQLSERQVALVSLDGASIAACARMTRGAKAVSFKWRVVLDEFVEFDAPVPFAELEAHVGAPTDSRITHARERGGGELPADDESRIVPVLQALRPHDAHAIADLLSISGPRRRQPLGAREPIVEYERDAVGLALDLGGLRRERVNALRSWAGATDEPFILEIGDFAVLEDRAIEHDARVFGGWRMIEASVVGAARFESRGRRVTVINANRSPVERTLGVDLIYYTHDFNAFVIVQYKRMTSGSVDDDTWAFRPDAQLKAELDRMRAIEMPLGDIASPSEFRLDEGCCYLKICSSRTIQPFSDNLMGGIYIPLAYWDCLVKSGSMSGPRGGTALTFDNVGRYLTNTLFVELVKASWVGSRGVTTKEISDVVRKSLAADRSLILAHAETDESDG